MPTTIASAAILAALAVAACVTAGEFSGRVHAGGAGIAGVQLEDDSGASLTATDDRGHFQFSPGDGIHGPRTVVLTKHDEPIAEHTLEPGAYVDIDLATLDDFKSDRHVGAGDACEACCASAHP